MKGWDIEEPEKPITSEFFNKVRKTMENVHQSQLQRMTKKIKRKILRNAAIGNSRMTIITNKNEAVIKQMCNQLEKEGFEMSYSRDYNVAGQHKIYISWYTA